MTNSGHLPDELIAAARRTLSGDRMLRRRLPGWGRLHIDRRQPFLCVYRKPPGRTDAGTDTLLLSQASYLLASGDDSIHASLRDLTAGLITELARTFGRVALLELWSAAGNGEQPSRDGEGGPPEFRIVAPTHAPPQSTLDTLERALVAINTPDGPPKIALDYERNPGPPGLPPILPAAEADRIGCTVLGMEIAPIYRAAENGPLYPDILRSMRHDIGHVLKQTFYTFSHTEASFHPAHFHELGRRAMTRAVWEADRQLGEVGDAFDLLLLLTPTNSEAAWNAFRRNKFQSMPDFYYQPLTVDPATLKQRLYRIPIERIEDPALQALFESKRDELDRQITMLTDRGTPRVLYGSLQVFGPADSSLMDQAHRILASVPPHTHDDAVSDFVDARTFAHHAEAEIRRLRKSAADLPATVQIRDDVPGLIVSRGHLLIGREAHVAKARVEATVQHEVGTHILTYYNGQHQPFHQLHTGTAGYDEMQEGIAVLAEYLVGGLSRPRLRLLAGRTLAADHVARGAEFVETFRMLHDNHSFSQKTAYTMAMRVYRGGGFTKDIIYLRGLLGVLARLATGTPLIELLIGKFALHHFDLMEELVWRKVLKPARLRPTYLNDPKAQARLERIASSTHPDILDLMTGELR